MATEKHYLDKDGLSYLKTKMDETYAAKSELDTAKQELQTSIESKAESTHQHVATDITDASETWAEKTHTHTAEGITDGDEHWALVSHTHTAAEVTGVAAEEHAHDIADVTELETRLTTLQTNIDAVPKAPIEVAVDTTDWVEADGSFSKAFTATGANITDSMAYVAGLEQGTEADAAAREAFGQLVRGVITAENQITLYAKAAPTAAFTLILVPFTAKQPVAEVLGLLGGGGTTVTGIGVKPINDAVVTLSSNTFTYNTKPQAPTINSVSLNGEALTVYEDYVGWIEGQTNAGSYNATAFGIMDYGGVKQTPWTIAKAEGSISCTPATVQVSGVLGSTAQVTLTVVGDGAITVSTNEFVKGEVSGDKAKITLTSLKETSAAQTLTVTLAEGTNYKGASCTISVTVQVASKTLEDNTWDVIAQISASGTASTMWKVGDTKTLKIGSDTYNAQIIGFDHDDLASSDGKYADTGYNGGKKKAGITFQMKELLKDSYRMDETSSNSCSWKDSEMRVTTVPKILATVDTTLQNVLRSVSKKTATSYSNGSIITTVDKLFLLSHIEVFNNTTNCHPGEGTVYAFWQANNSNSARVKSKLGGSAAYWWLRSPSSSYSSYFRMVYSDGSANPNYATYAYGVALGFCV